jgi:hypothetical protein
LPLRVFDLDRLGRFERGDAVGFVASSKEEA